MFNRTDIVLINPGNKKQVYQELSNEIAAVEPPFWIAVIASFLRNKGISVSIIDSNAENYSPDQTAKRVNEINPILAAVIVYGSQPSASTQNMTSAIQICKTLKEMTSSKVAIGGLHPSALPLRTLEETEADFVIEGEGPYTLEKLLLFLKEPGTCISGVPGLWYRVSGNVKNNPKAPLISDLDKMFPIAAWDLLPMERYTAHNWHCFDNLNLRKPYASVYTSLGCPYNCVFCCINALFGKPGIRYRSPELVVEEISLLVEKYGIRNLKIADELFILNENHYMKIINLLIKRSYDLNIWAYARVDTIRPEHLKQMKKAGINWLALGIESGNQVVIDRASKRLKTVDVGSMVRTIRDEGIHVIGNYIFGLPDDNFNTMKDTLNLAMDLNCEFVNFYCAMAYPGSSLYDTAVGEGWELPKEWHGFSQHSYETLPLRTKYISAKDVLKFRDDAFHAYFENPAYLNMIEAVFGIKTRKHVQLSTKDRIKRKILE